MISLYIYIYIYQISHDISNSSFWWGKGWLNIWCSWYLNMDNAVEMGTCDTSRYEHAEAAASQLDVHGRVLGLDPLPYPPKMGRLKPQTGQSLLKSFVVLVCQTGCKGRSMVKRPRGNMSHTVLRRNLRVLCIPKLWNWGLKAAWIANLSPRLHETLRCWSWHIYLAEGGWEHLHFTFWKLIIPMTDPAGAGILMVNWW